MDVQQIGAVMIALLTVGGILARPWRSAEWMWAAGGALAEVAIGASPLWDAWAAIRRGADVYAFLIGILALAAAVRTLGIFEWLAGRAEVLARGSRPRALALCYGVGVLVTATLSNDAAIILLTPAALALGRRLGGSPLPYLYACPFVACAASFLLPTGNPANLLLYDAGLPPLGAWLATYALAALAAIGITYAGLAWISRRELAQACDLPADRPRSTAAVRVALWLLGASGLALACASALGRPLGVTALGCAAVTCVTLRLYDRNIAMAALRGTSWGVVPLVAGLLVVVAALERAGVTRLATRALDAAATLPPWLGREVTGFATMLIANGANNLPVAVFAGRALGASGAHPLAHAVVVATDLGPNLSVAGSLATLLWLIILRREDIEITPQAFFFRGAILTLPALFVALLLAR